jgi:hypothetical protein
LILECAETPDIIAVDKLDDTTRGSGGFGSTGINEIKSPSIQPIVVSALATAAVPEISSTNLLLFRGRLGRRSIQFLIDGGSKGNLLKETLVNDMGLQIDERGVRNIVLADGTTTYRGLRTSAVPVAIGNYRDKIDFLTAPIMYDAILGKPWLDTYNPIIDWSTNRLSFETNSGRHFWQSSSTTEATTTDGFLTAKQLTQRLKQGSDRVFLLQLSVNESVVKTDENLQQFLEAVDNTTADKPLYLRELLLEYRDVFKDVDALPPSRGDLDHPIELIEDSKAPWRPVYPMTPEELDLLKKEIDRLEGLGFIRRSVSPYGAPLFFVLEKTGKIRMVFDYRALNKLTIKNRCALPNIPETLARLRDARIFTKIDLQSGYHLIRMREGDEHKTAFRCRYGHYEFLVMPFGLCNAPATFQTLMNEIFKDVLDQFLVVYLDDILVYSRTIEEHAEHLKIVLDKLRQNKLRSRVHKCRFLQPKVDYLGYIVGEDKIIPDDDKVAAVQTWPPPRDVTELRAFLGLANTLLRFTPMYASHAAPLTDLLKGAPAKHDKLDWLPVHQQAFDNLKAALSSPQNLHIPDPNLPIILHTDWSINAIGGWISQDIDGQLLPIAFESRKLRPAEHNYSPYDGELLALMHCLQTF